MILQGDCLDILPTIPDASVDLTVFSPPYDDIRKYGGGWKIDLPAVGRELLRVTVDGGMVAVVIQDSTKHHAKTGTSFRTFVNWMDAGWRLWECLIYHRYGVPGAWWATRFRVDHEYIGVFLKGERPITVNNRNLDIPAVQAGSVYKSRKSHIRSTKGHTLPCREYVVNDMKCRGTVWGLNTTSQESRTIKTGHPATFPDRLAADLITCFSRPGDHVLDPMCGSGTTCRMAERLGRRWTGIEINPEYVEIANRLLADEAKAVSA